eukprot:gene39191-59305_t
MTTLRAVNCCAVRTPADVTDATEECASIALSFAPMAKA